MSDEPSVTPQAQIQGVIEPPHVMASAHHSRMVPEVYRPMPWPALPFQILYFEDLSVGMVETHSKTVKSSDVVGFAEITGDRNPIHLSEHFAAKTPFKGRIAHGLYTASLISAVIGTRLPGPGAIYVSQTLRFLAPVKIGDTVDAIVEVVDLSEQRQRVRLLCTCKVGNTVVLEGEAIVKVPRHQQD